MSQNNIITIAKEGAEFVLVPASQVTFLKTNLSISNHQDLQAALPYALEDEVVQNVEDLHFAWARASDSANQLHVTVTSHEFMQPLKEQYNDPEFIAIPDVLVLPWTEGRWCVVVDGERALVRTGMYDGFECHKSNLASQIKLYLRGDTPPKKIHYWYQNEEDLSCLPKNIKPLTQTDKFNSLKNWLAKNAMPAANLNLFSGEYETKKSTNFSFMQWLPAVALVLISLIIHFGYSWYQIITLETEQKQLVQQSEDLFRQAFPNVKKLVRPKVQAEQELKKLGASSSDSDNPFYEIYGSILKTSNQFPDIKLLSFSWKNGRFDYQLEANSMTSIESFNKKLNELGYMSEVSNFVNDNGKAKSKLVIKGAL